MSCQTWRRTRGFHPFQYIGTYSSTVFACETSDDSKLVRCDLPLCSQHGRSCKLGFLSTCILFFFFLFFFFFYDHTLLLLILKTIGNRKGDCAWSCSRWQTQPEKICKSQRTNQCHSLRTLYWFVLCNLQIFSGCVCHLEQLHAQSPFLFPIVFSINGPIPG